MIPSGAALVLLLLCASSLLVVATAQNGTGALRRANKIKPPKCPANQQYLPNVQIGCPASCDQPIPMCKAAIAPGCGCPDGQVLAGGGTSTTNSWPPRSPAQCIPPKSCPKNAVPPPMSWSECPNGAMPLANAHCGRGGSPCPTAYTCNIDPLDRFAVCCPDAYYVPPPSPPLPPPVATSQCPNGAAPLAGAYCGRGGSPCPTGHDCVIDPADRFAVCCPRNGVVTPPPSSQCPRGATPLAGGAYCGRGGQRCPKGFKCNIDPADRFAVCCPDYS